MMPQQFAPQQFAPQQFAMAGMPAQQGNLSYLPAPISAVTVPNVGAQVPAVAAQVAPAPYVGAQFAQAPAVTAQVGAPKSAAEFYKAYAASQNSYLPPVAASVAPTTFVESFTAPFGTAMAAPTTIAPAVVQAPTTIAPATTYASTVAPAVEYISAPPAVSYSQPAPAVEYISAPPAVSYTNPPVAMPQATSYIPAPMPAAVETIVQQPTFTETIMPQPAYTTAPNVVTQGAVSYLPPAQPVMYEQVVGAGAFDPAGQSVIVEQIGDWLVCEDAMGLFFHHAPTQQSFDNAPPEFLMLFPQGYQPPPLGAFAQSGMGLTAAPAAVSYAQPAPAMMPAVGSYLPPAPVFVEQFAAPTTYAAVSAPTAYAAPQAMMQSAPVMVEQFASAPMVMGATPSYAPQFPGQMAPMMAKAYY